MLSTIGEEFQSALLNAFAQRSLSIRSVFVEELSRMEWSIVEHLKTVRCSLSHAPVTATFQHKCCRAEGLD